MKWIATACAALDLRGREAEFPGVEVAVLPTVPSEPLGLFGDSASLWMRLVKGGVDDENLAGDDSALLLEFADAGLASQDLGHPRKVIELAEPWFASGLHELVTALVMSVAADHGIRVLVVKGPVLHRQGLRQREHSADVDVLVDPESLYKLVEALETWGWQLAPDVWAGTVVNHSVTLVPAVWGCEIDLHRHIPGCDLPDAELFSVIEDRSVPVEFASVAALTPQSDTHAVLFALNELRPVNGRVPGGESKVNDVVAMLQGQGLGALEGATTIRANAALRTALQEAFPEDFVIPDYREPLNWRWRDTPFRVIGYGRALGIIPFRKRLRMILRLVWPSTDVIEQTNRHNGLAEPAGRGSRVKRWLRAIRSAK